MKESIMMVVNAYRDFNEAGMYMALFLCSLTYIWYTDQTYQLRKMWVYPSLGFFALIFNPFIMRYIIDQAFDYASKPRVYWVFPIICVIAMVATLVVTRCRTDREKMVLGALLCVVFIICGKFKYSNEYLVKPTNAYDLPQEVVDIADYALSEYETPRLVVPIELATAMRSYSSDIRLLYGEDVVYGRIQYMGWTPFGPEKPQYTVYQSMKEEVPDVAAVIDIITDYQCDYIVFDNMTQTGYEDIEQLGCYKVKTISHYDIYKIER